MSDKPLPTIERLSVWSYPPKPDGLMGISVREKILYILHRLREMPGLHHLLRIIPHHWQRKVKRWFSHRPIHDVIGDQAVR